TPKNLKRMINGPASPWWWTKTRRDPSFDIDPAVGAGTAQTRDHPMVSIRHPAPGRTRFGGIGADPRGSHGGPEHGGGDGHPAKSGGGADRTRLDGSARREHLAESGRLELLEPGTPSDV